MYGLDALDAPPALATTVNEERARSIISHSQSPDVGFSQSINPYRGCELSDGLLSVGALDTFFSPWEFNEQGLMQRRFASINDLPIRVPERKFFWPLGRRPDEHPGPGDLDL